MAGARRTTRTPTPQERAGRPWNATILRALWPTGQVLWPGHNDLEQFRDIYESGDTALFKSVWMQDPSGLAGDVFHPEWFQDWCYPNQTEDQPSATRPGQWVTLTAEDLLREGLVQAILPDVRELVSLQACDLALKAKETNDFYARTNCYSARTGEMFFTDAKQARLSDLKMVDEMAAAARKWKARAIGIESNAFGSLIFEQAKRGHGLPWVELDPAGNDKVVRARPLAAHCERMKVYFHYGARWNQGLRYHLLEFPGGAHDDLTDSGAYLFELALKYTPGQWRDIREAQEELRKLAKGGDLSKALS